MKGRQIKRLISFLETGQLCRENISIISLVPGMLKFAKEFDGLLLQILERKYKQAEPTDHNSKNKISVRKELAEHAAWLSSLASAYSSEIKCHAVGVFFEWSYTSLFRKRDSDLIPLCTLIHKKLTEHQEQLKEYGIKKKDIVLLADLTEQFQKIYTSPSRGINHRAVHTKFLTEHIDAASAFLYEKMDKMIPCFRQFPEFCKAFRQSRKQHTYQNPETILEKRIKDFYLSPQMPVLRKKKKVFEILELEVLISDDETKILLVK